MSDNEFTIIEGPYRFVTGSTRFAIKTSEYPELWLQNQPKDFGSTWAAWTRTPDPAGQATITSLHFVEVQRIVEQYNLDALVTFLS